MTKPFPPQIRECDVCGITWDDTEEGHSHCEKCEELSDDCTCPPCDGCKEHESDCVCEPGAGRCDLCDVATKRARRPITTRRSMHTLNLCDECHAVVDARMAEADRRAWRMPKLHHADQFGKDGA